jgi:hypothetical protein
MSNDTAPWNKEWAELSAKTRFVESKPEAGLLTPELKQEIVDAARQLLRSGKPSHEVISELEADTRFAKHHVYIHALVNYAKDLVAEDLAVASKAALAGWRNVFDRQQARAQSVEIYQRMVRYLRKEHELFDGDASRIATNTRQMIERAFFGEPVTELHISRAPLCLGCRLARAIQVYLDLTTLEETPACSKWCLEKARVAQQAEKDSG